MEQTVFTAKPFETLTTQELYEILKARSQVFMLEQNIHCLDMDGEDYRSLHVFAKEGKSIAAYLRAFLLPEENAVKIGRVLTVDRRKGMGRRLMKEAEDAIKKAFSTRRIVVDAQLQAAPFYEKCGFTPISSTFMEEGIPHVKMEKILP